MDIHRARRLPVRLDTRSLRPSSSWPVHPGCVVDVPPSASCVPPLPRAPATRKPSETAVQSHDIPRDVRGRQQPIANSVSVDGPITQLLCAKSR